MPVRVLIVDDDRTNRLVLKAVLQKYDYEIIEAADGEEAVKIYAEQAPDIVLMDIMMPVMDGYEATRRIKSMAQGVFVPVIFLTAVTDEEALARCVDVGGDDFITKPYNHIILKAKMDAMFRIKELNDTIVSQHRELSYHHNRLNKEQEIAERIYSNIIKAGYKDVAGIKYLSSPLSLFNGDLLLFAVRPTGSLHVLVGDFTGHGLAAAIGALPVSDIFYAMTSAGFSMRDIVSSINEKLSGILPVDLFFCAAVLDIDPLAGSVSVWSGGMPDLLVMDEHNTIQTRIQSAHVPLGIIPPARFDCKLNMVNVRPGDRLYICSDGVTEMRDADGQMLGQEGLEQLFTEGVAPEQVYDHVIARLDEHRGHAEANDDLTLVEITCLAQRYDSEDTMERDFKEREPTNWSLSLSLDKASLIDFDPLPSLSRTIMEIQGLYRYKEKVYTVLAELIGNAIDHGMLGLDSSIRSTADGFARYYQERETGLRDGVDGRLDVDIRHVCDAAGGRLLVSVHDSGSGFSIAGVCNTLDDANAKSGRGIPLVKSLCQSLSYNDKGNRAEAVFKWRAQDSDDDSALDEPTQAGEGI